jgi:hypothetical protein
MTQGKNTFIPLSKRGGKLVDGKGTLMVRVACWILNLDYEVEFGSSARSDQKLAGGEAYRRRRARTPGNIAITREP